MIEALERRSAPFTGRSFARFIGSSPDFVLAEIRAGRLRAFRFGSWFRIDPRDAREWLEGQRVLPGGPAESVLVREEARRPGA